MTDSFQYDVFLSHSSKDKPIVRDIAERLRADGLKVWFDEWVLKPGDSIPAMLEEGLEHSRVLVFCVFVEFLLNQAGALTWDYTWWNRGAPWFIFLIGYLPFFLVAFWVFDMDSLKRKIEVVSAIYAFDITCLVLFAGVLKWI